MQTADPTFTMGLRLLLAARRIETCEDDYARERLQALAEVYRERGTRMACGAATPALHSF
jgi:hypothetical protein